MSKTLCGAINTIAVAAGVTNYIFIGAGSLGANTTEAPAQRTMRKAGTFSRLYVSVSANTLSGSCVVTLRKNTAAGNLTVTIPAGTTGRFVDTAHTDAISLADLAAVQVAAAAGSGSITIVAILLNFGLAGTAATALLGADSVGAAMTATASATRFLPPCAAVQTAITTEAAGAPKVDIAGTFRNLQVYVTANTRTTTSTIQFRKNGGNGNQVISIGAGVTGFLEDAVNTDAVVAGDTINIEHINGTGVGAVTYSLVAVEFDSGAARKSPLFAYQTSAVTTLARPISMIGTSSGSTTSAHQLGFAAKASNLRAYITANTRDDTEAIATNFSGAAAGSVALSASFGATLTGEFSDTTHEDSIYPGDLYQINRGNADSVGSYSTAWTALTLEHIEPVETQVVVSN